MASEQRIAFSETNFEQLQLIGIRVSPAALEPEYHALVLYHEVARNDKNRPMTHEGRLIFFSKPTSANNALRLGDPAFRKYAPFAGEVSYVYDIPKVVDLILRGEEDPGAQVLNLINELFDFVAATPLPMPTWARKALEDLADYATFDRDLEGFFKDDPGSRKLSADAVIWSVGAVCLSAELVE
ncbi:MAG: hypothetical protein U0104_12665 [Gemmatimonadales bacterium]